MREYTDDELLDNSAQLALEDLAHRMGNSKLMALRAQNPFIQILPFPNETRGYALPAGVAVDINLPSGTKMIRFVGDGNYYVSRKGNASAPVGVANEDGSGSIMKPEYGFFFVEEISQLSVISTAGCNLTVHCFTQL